MKFIQETKNLQLRRPTIADGVTLQNLWQNKTVRQYLGGVVSEEASEEKNITIQKHWEECGFGQNAVVNKMSEQIIGLCGLHHSDDGIELSYMFFPEFWGRGFATEAVLACLDHGFNYLNFEKIIAITQEANIKSRRLLERVWMQYFESVERFGVIQNIYKIEKQ